MTTGSRRHFVDFGREITLDELKSAFGKTFQELGFEFTANRLSDGVNVEVVKSLPTDKNFFQRLADKFFNREREIRIYSNVLDLSRRRVYYVTGSFIADEGRDLEPIMLFYNFVERLPGNLPSLL